jgi:protein TonB
MNNEGNMNPQEYISAEMENRIMAWASGEASSEEAAELATIAAANPAVAAFKAQVDSALRLAVDAGTPDREPMRLSDSLRRELLETLTAGPRGHAESGSPVPTLSSIPTLMRKLNLAYAAVFSVVLIAGVAWWGEQSHFAGRVLHRDPPATHDTFTVKPDDPDPVEAGDPMPKKTRDEIAPPAQQDYPSKPKPDDFVEKIEPPHPVIDNKLVKVPVGNGTDGMASQVFDPSQLEQQAEPTYQARPVYPFTMKRDGIAGQVTVDFIVDPSGAVRNVVAVHSSQHDFEEPACAAVAKWKFKPGRKGGRAVFVHMQVPIVFSLSADGS